MPRLLRPAVFLDRDGVINKTVMRNDVSCPPASVEEFQFLPGVIEASRRLAESGWPLVVVTNQPDVARGTQRRETVEKINDLIFCGLPVLEIFTCFHDTGDQCDCRKPKPGLLHQAARRWNLDTRRSIMIGDRWSDVVAGQAAGCKTILVETPHSKAERCQPDVRVRSLVEATEWIASSIQQPSAVRV